MNMNVAMFFNVILFFIGANKLKDIFTGGKLPTKRNERTNEMQIISGPSVARAVELMNLLIAINRSHLQRGER